ncbi:FISUMP domain-containing protein [Luteibaculum oceani]|uniref:Fibrobacter succinogenes major paralogous domain-containing protein n=1 Tax=Luteibaculum oceani TaxID=1294296 RepID=A0A5C6VBN0_9FLAO|nr:FISUMP domain-containing protein [Luteibaculum oceani]TXC82071.1 hypothetical protein FRX97_02970 [Luteibaculum oceani]
MKNLATPFSLYLLLFFSSCTQPKKIKNQEISNLKTSHFVDIRDGKKYKTVLIGNQWWMAENLAFKTEGSVQVDGPDNRNYGRLYHWNEALLACPKGWALASDRDWTILETLISDNLNVFPGSTWRGKHGYLLKSLHNWKLDGNGIDKYGFNVHPAGHIIDDSPPEFGYTAGYWTSSGSVESGIAWVRFFAAPKNGVNRLESDINTTLLFCRCIKE